MTTCHPVAHRLWAWRIAQVLPSLVVLVVGLRYISIVPLWTDELYGWAAVREGLGVDHGEPFLLPFYTAIWALTGGGQCLSEACLRWPGLAAASITVLLIGLTTGRIGGRPAGVAGSFLIMGVVIVHRSTLELRHYAISAMLIAGTLYVLQIVSGRPSLRWPWPSYAVLLVVAGVIQPVSLAALAGHGVLVFGTRNPLLRRRWLITLACCSPLGLAAGIIYLRSGDYGGAESYGELIPSLENLSQAVTWPVSGGTLTLPAIGAIAGILLMLALDTSVGRRWLLAGVASMALIYMVSLGSRDFWFGRFLWPLIGFFAVAAALAFRNYSRWRTMGVVALVLALCYPVFLASIAPWSRGTDFRTGMAIVDANWQQGDVFRVINVTDQWGMERYGAAGPYPTVETATSPDHAVWSFGLLPPCAEPESWKISPEISLWRCPAGSPPILVTP